MSNPDEQRPDDPEVTVDPGATVNPDDTADTADIERGVPVSGGPGVTQRLPVLVDGQPVPEERSGPHEPVAGITTDAERGPDDDALAEHGDDALAERDDHDALAERDGNDGVVPGVDEDAQARAASVTAPVSALRSEPAPLVEPAAPSYDRAEAPRITLPDLGRDDQGRDDLGRDDLGQDDHARSDLSRADDPDHGLPADRAATATAAARPDADDRTVAFVPVASDGAPVARATDARGHDATTLLPAADAPTRTPGVAAAAPFPSDDERADAPFTAAEVLDRQKEHFAGFRFGSAFFGAIAAVGLTVLLVAVLGGIASAIGVGPNGGSMRRANAAAAADADTVALVAAIVFAVVLLVAYFCGGYVAARMARFDGAKQGLAVWFWAILFALVGVAFAWFSGADRSVSTQMDAMPTIAGSALLTVAIAIVVVLAIMALGAVLGGLAGMRFHRRVDRIGFDRSID